MKKKKGKGWPETVHPVHVHAVDALTGKVKLGTKLRPALSNRQIHTLLDLDMKTVKALKEDEAYRERVLARKGPLRTSKQDMLSPILAQLEELRGSVKALDKKVLSLKEKRDIVTDSEEATEVPPAGEDAPAPEGPDGGERTEEPEPHDEPLVDRPGHPPGRSGEPGEPGEETAGAFFPVGK